MTIEEQWRAIAEEACGDPGWRLRLAKPLKDLPLFVGLHEGRRALLLRVEARLLPSRRLWPSCRGLELSVLQFSGHVHFAVTLLDARYADVFLILAEDLARRVEQAGSQERAVTVFLDQLSKWQRFLAAGAAGLSAEQQRGLWGELHFLVNRLVSRLGPSVAVAGWRGPSGAHQDFQFRGLHVEVKTTMSMGPQTVRITSERQLDRAFGGALFMHVLALEGIEGAGGTLPEAVAAARLVTAGEATVAFEDALADAGYLDRHAPLYETTGYILRNAEDYEVRDGFPHLGEASLPEGIGDVSYQVALAACAGFATDSGILDASLTNLLKHKFND